MKTLDVLKLGEFLRESRKKQRLTQSDVANHLGISAQAISKWERGENLPDVTFFPDIAKLYHVSIEKILNAGEETEETLAVQDQVLKIQQLIDEKLFKSILAKFKEVDDIVNLDMPMDFFAFLNVRQKSELIEVILSMQHYEIALEDILSHTNSVHRLTIFRKVLEKEDYERLEPWVTYMNKSIKTEVLSRLLETKIYDVIEDMMPFFTREHKDMIVEFFDHTSPDEEIIENYLPFLDRKQTEKIIRRFYHE